MSRPSPIAPSVAEAIRERIRTLEAELAHWRGELARYGTPEQTPATDPPRTQPPRPPRRRNPRR